MGTYLLLRYELFRQQAANAFAPLKQFSFMLLLVAGHALIGLWAPLVLLGFQLQGTYSTIFNVLDLQEGQFVSEQPVHPFFIEGDAASITARLYQITAYEQLENIQLHSTRRRELLENYLQFYALHIHDFVPLRSLPVLKEVLQ